MKRLSILIVAGEPSGDLLASELVSALRATLMTDAHDNPTRDAQPLSSSLEPEFFGAGGPEMARQGVKLTQDLTQNSVIGPTDVIKNYAKFRRVFDALIREAEARMPDIVVLVDFSHFNQRLAAALRKRTRQRKGVTQNWRPLLVKYVSPQVWASRPKRATQVARDFDLLLCILPFEKDWYATRVPALDVVYVGHWIMDRYPSDVEPAVADPGEETVLLLPGSRPGEIRRHGSVLLEAYRLLSARPRLSGVMVLPSESLRKLFGDHSVLPPKLSISVGGLTHFLRHSTIGIASTGSVTLECARFGLPTVALYKTSWLTYQIARHLVTVPYLAMPNILAQAPLYPEFIQDAATPEALASEATSLLSDPARRLAIRQRLKEAVSSLGNGGAGYRAAATILDRLARKRSTASAP